MQFLKSIVGSLSSLDQERQLKQQQGQQQELLNMDLSISPASSSLDEMDRYHRQVWLTLHDQIEVTGSIYPKLSFDHQPKKSIKEARFGRKRDHSRSFSRPSDYDYDNEDDPYDNDDTKGVRNVPYQDMAFVPFFEEKKKDPLREVSYVLNEVQQRVTKLELKVGENDKIIGNKEKVKLIFAELQDKLVELDDELFRNLDSTKEARTQLDRITKVLSSTAINAYPPDIVSVTSALESLYSLLQDKMTPIFTCIKVDQITSLLAGQFRQFWLVHIADQLKNEAKQSDTAALLRANITALHAIAFLPNQITSSAVSIETIAELVESLLPYLALDSDCRFKSNSAIEVPVHLVQSMVEGALLKFRKSPYDGLMGFGPEKVLTVLIRLLHRFAKLAKEHDDESVNYAKMYGQVLGSLVERAFAQARVDLGGGDYVNDPFLTNEKMNKIVLEFFEPFEYYSEFKISDDSMGMESLKNVLTHLILNNFLNWDHIDLIYAECKRKSIDFKTTSLFRFLKNLLGSPPRDYEEDDEVKVIEPIEPKVKVTRRRQTAIKDIRGLTPWYLVRDKDYRNHAKKKAAVEPKQKAPVTTTIVLSNDQDNEVQGSRPQIPEQLVEAANNLANIQAPNVGFAQARSAFTSAMSTFLGAMAPKPVPITVEPSREASQASSSHLTLPKVTQSPLHSSQVTLAQASPILSTPIQAASSQPFVKMCKTNTYTAAPGYEQYVTAPAKTQTQSQMPPKKKLASRLNASTMPPWDSQPIPFEPISPYQKYAPHYPSYAPPPPPQPAPPVASGIWLPSPAFSNSNNSSSNSNRNRCTQCRFLPSDPFYPGGNHCSKCNGSYNASMDARRPPNQNVSYASSYYPSPIIHDLSQVQYQKNLNRGAPPVNNLTEPVRRSSVPVTSQVNPKANSNSDPKGKMAQLRKCFLPSYFPQRRFQPQPQLSTKPSKPLLSEPLVHNSQQQSAIKSTPQVEKKVTKPLETIIEPVSQPKEQSEVVASDKRQTSSSDGSAQRPILIADEAKEVLPLNKKKRLIIEDDDDEEILELLVEIGTMNTATTDTTDNAVPKAVEEVEVVTSNVDVAPVPESESSFDSTASNASSNSVEFFTPFAENITPLGSPNPDSSKADLIKQMHQMQQDLIKSQEMFAKLLENMSNKDSQNKN